MSDEIDAELDPWLAKQIRNDGTENEATNNECPRCGKHLLDTGRTVTGRNGTTYDVIEAAPPAMPCYCPGCYRERQAIENSRANASLTDFGGMG